jgi:hypothetical protein
MPPWHAGTSHPNPFLSVAQGLVFIDKHVQPSNDPCLGSLMQQYYGQLDAENTIRNVVGITASGTPCGRGHMARQGGRPTRAAHFFRRHARDVL